jgi:PAS domain S-box-containing protein
LYRYEILETPPEPSFDRLTRLAALIFSAPISLITILDSGRQIFKSHYGTDLQETPRDDSFYAHALHASGVTVVCDATLDPRFADNPLVLGDPHIRFYVAAPLETSDGFRLGALCVVDSKPRYPPDPRQIAALEDLAACAIELLGFHRAKIELAKNRKLCGKTERRAAAALEAGRMGYWEQDADSDLITLSPALEKMLGIKHNEYDGSIEGWFKHVHPDDHKTILRAIQEARRTCENCTIKYRLLTADGTERWITTTGAYGKDQAGNFAGAHGVSWDSTAADVAARELRLSEELFRGLSNTAPVGVFRSDVNWHVTYANAKFAEIFAMTEHEVLGQGWLQRIHPDDRGALPTALDEAGAKNSSSQYECRLLLPNGTVRWISAQLAILRDQSGQVVAKIGTVDDITQRRQTIHDLRAAKDAAEVANAAKDVFLANVSHELRTPLNGILGMNNVLLESGLTSKQLEMAELVQASAHGLMTVVNDILELRSLESDRLPFEPMAFNLRSTIREVVALFEWDARQKGLKLVTRYPAHLPESYLGDKSRIKQILINYLSNALKFTAAGEINVTAQSEAADLGTGLLLAVSDGGSGIALEAQSRLFLPFSQLDDSSTRRSGGAGLGLAISKRLAELMGGSVGVTSAPGEGSTFWVRLPLERQSPVLAPARLPESVPVKGSGRVLLVEDNPINQKVATGVLHKLGWEADVAENGLKAVKLFQQNEYVAVLMDCQMPEMDGYAATRQIRHWESLEGRQSVPIIALTAHAMPGDRERCLQAGMDDYLAKPCGLEHLRNALNRWVAVPV